MVEAIHQNSAEPPSSFAAICQVSGGRLMEVGRALGIRRYVVRVLAAIEIGLSWMISTAPL